MKPKAPTRPTTVDMDFPRRLPSAIFVVDGWPSFSAKDACALEDDQVYLERRKATALNRREEKPSRARGLIRPFKSGKICMEKIPGLI
jgi:hypothetical protein